MKKISIILVILFVGGLMVSQANAASRFSAQAQGMSVADILDWLEKYSPSITADFVIIKSIAPEVYMEVMEEAATEIQESEDLRQTHPEQFQFFLETDEFEVRSIRLAVQLVVEADEEKKQAMKSEIKSLVEQLFDQRLQQHKMVVNEIEQEVKELKRIEKVHEKNKERIIKHRYEYLTNPDSEALKWW